jgi:hypothetical protein
LAGHDLGVDKFLFSLSGLSDFFLDGLCLWFNAHVNKLLSRLGSDGVFSDNFSAAVGKTSSLDLKVRKLVDFCLGQCIRGGGGKAEGKCTGGGYLSSVHEIILQGHLQLASAL